MSASREKKNRPDATYVQHRNNKEADKDRRKHVLYGIVGVIVAVLAVALLVWDSGFFQKRSTAVTIDGEAYGPAIVQYYYQAAYNNASYLAAMGSGPALDTSLDPADQIYDEETGQTWQDYLVEQAIYGLTQVTVLCHAAEAEGYTLTAADQANLDQQLAAIDEVWRSNGTYGSLEGYLRVNYNNYMDEETFLTLCTDQALAASYQTHYQNSLTYTEEEAEEYYLEHSDELDTYTYSILTVHASVEEELDAEGNPVERTEEETQAAFETAKAEAQALAQEIQERLDAGEEAQTLADEYSEQLFSAYSHTTTMGSSLSASLYADWLFDAGRQAGDTTIEENDGSASNTYTYYVIQFDHRERDDSPTADVRHILISAGQSPTEESFAQAEEEAQALLEQWKAGEATEDSFAALAVQYTADTASQSSGGLYTGIASIDGLEPNFLNWALDPARQPGDTGIVKNESSSIQGWHIMYFVGWDDPAWMYDVKSPWRNEDTSEWLTSLSDSAEVIHGSGLNYIF